MTEDETPSVNQLMSLMLRLTRMTYLAFDSAQDTGDEHYVPNAYAVEVEKVLVEMDALHVPPGLLTSPAGKVAYWIEKLTGISYDDPSAPTLNPLPVNIPPRY